MMKVMVDADLILEAFINREGFVTDATEAFELLQSDEIQGYISELGLKRIYDLISTLASDEIVEDVMSTIEESIEVCPVNTFLIQQARSINIRDFESAVEISCAVKNDIAVILTQDPDFIKTDFLPVLTVDTLSDRHELNKKLVNNISQSSFRLTYSSCKYIPQGNQKIYRHKYRELRQEKIKKTSAQKLGEALGEYLNDGIIIREGYSESTSIPSNLESDWSEPSSFQPSSTAETATNRFMRTLERLKNITRTIYKLCLTVNLTRSQKSKKSSA